MDWGCVFEIDVIDDGICMSRSLYFAVPFMPNLTLHFVFFEFMTNLHIICDKG